MIEAESFNDFSQEEARSLYLKIIKDLPLKNIDNKISINQTLSSNKINLWWYLLISEKNIWVDKSIHRLFEIQRLINLNRESEFDELLLFIDDKILETIFINFCKINKIKISINKERKLFQGDFSFFIKYYLQAFRSGMGIIMKKIILFLSNYSTDIVIKENSIAFFSFFPFFWKKNDKNYKKDGFFNSLPIEIKKSKPVLHIIWLMPLNSFFKFISELNIFIKKENTYVLESGIKFKDTLSLLNYKLYLKFFKIFKSKDKIKIKLSNGLNISEIFFADIINSLLSPTLFQSLLIDISMSKVDLSKIEKLLFRLEFQPFERAILNNTKNKVKTIGFQHSALSRNFLNYIFIENELKHHWDQKDNSASMPLPDYIFTSGSIGHDYMIEAGYPKERTFICGALRYNELRLKADNISSRKDLRIKNNLSLSDQIIFVVTTPILFETVEMLNSILLAVELSKEEKRNYYIIIKHHPNTKNMRKYVSEIKKTLESWQNSIRYKSYWDGIDVHEFIKISNYVITTGGTIPLEAMILKVPSIIYTTNNQFSHNPILDYPNSTIIVDDYMSLHKALNNNMVELLKNEWVKPINIMFGEFYKDQNQKFINLMNQLD